MTIIAALTKDRVIGSQGKLPWHIPEEYEHFLQTIKNQTVIIGRKSYETFGATLTSFHTIVVSRSPKSLPKAITTQSIEEAVALAKTFGKEIYIAGGTQIYQQTMPLADRMLLSFIKGDYVGDSFFPPVSPEWTRVCAEDRDSYTLAEYRKASV
jgi:dihydrofolate reductase